MGRGRDHFSRERERISKELREADTAAQKSLISIVLKMKELNSAGRGVRKKEWFSLFVHFF